LSPPSFLEALFQNDYSEFLERAQIELIVPIGGQISADLRKLFGIKQIPVRGAYSSEEVSLIGSECEHYPYHYHVAHSNVVIEVDKNNSVDVGGNTLHRILVTSRPRSFVTISVILELLRMLASAVMTALQS
jgi:phenylacetate-CoA ligase